MATPYKLISAATTNATSVTAVPTALLGITAQNATAALRYLKLYDKAAAPVVGTDVPVETIALQPNSTFRAAYPRGLAFLAGLACALTAGQADTDATAVAAGDVLVDLEYQPGG